MLIIFDLDDTLVDTSGSIIPQSLWAMVETMRDHGLPVNNTQEEVALLKQLNACSFSGRDALEEYIALKRFDRKFLSIGLQCLYGEFDRSTPVQTTDSAVEVLRELARTYTLAIVSQGERIIQQSKLEKAGIDTSLFSTIVVCEEFQKKIHYQELIRQVGLHPFEVVVCGDRIERDLTPAKELGCRTVHMRWGRGLGFVNARCDVDYAILHLEELKQILIELQSS